MPVTKETYSNQNFYGKWLPVPVIDRIVITDNKITPHISINLKAFKVGSPGYIEENAPQQVYDHIIKNLNFYVMWSLGESTHKAVKDNNTHIFSMLSSSVEMRENQSRLLGMSANFVTLNFESAEPVLIDLDGEEYYKWVTSADIQIGEADDSDTEDENEERAYSFNPLDDDYMWGENYFDVGSVFTEESELEAAKSHFFNLYLYSFCSVKNKSDEEYVGTNSEVYDLVHKDYFINDMLCSDISYHQVFKSTTASNTTPVLNTQPFVVYKNDPNAIDGVYPGIPIMGTDGFYYRAESVTFEHIHDAFFNFFGTDGTPEAATDGDPIGADEEEVEEPSDAVNNFKFIYDKFMYTPRILVELNQLLQAWPSKTPNTPDGSVYLTISNILGRLISSLRVDERIEKYLMYNSVIVDSRGSGFADWCGPHKTFMGETEIPSATERSWLLGNVAGSTDAYAGYQAGLEGGLQGMTEEDYVIYPHYYMHRAGVNLIYDDTLADWGLNYTYEDIVNKGYFFIDYERIAKNYLLVSQLWSITSLEGIFGKQLTNSLIQEQALNFTRYNSDLVIDPVYANIDEPIKEFVVQFDQDLGYPLATSIIHENITTQYSSTADSVGYAYLDIDTSYNVMGGEYAESTTTAKHSYVVPRNFDVLSETNFRDNMDNYRLLCLEFEDYYPFSIAKDWAWDETVDVDGNPAIGPEKSSSTTEYYHVVFNIKDNSLELISILITDFFDAVDSFQEYANYALEACSYNSITDSFNSYFVNAMRDLYGESSDSPWSKAAWMYNLHMDLLYQTHGGVASSVRSAAQELVPLIDPDTGSLESINLLLESLQQLLEIYGGMYDTEAYESGEVSYSESWIPGSVYNLFGHHGSAWYEYSGDPRRFVPTSDPIDMQFEQVLECFPPIIYADVETDTAITLAAEDPGLQAELILNTQLAALNDDFHSAVEAAYNSWAETDAYVREEGYEGEVNPVQSAIADTKKVINEYIDLGKEIRDVANELLEDAGLEGIYPVYSSTFKHMLGQDLSALLYTNGLLYIMDGNYEGSEDLGTVTEYELGGDYDMIVTRMYQWADTESYSAALD